MERGPQIVSVFEPDPSGDEQKAQKRRRARERAFNARTGLLTSLMIARWAIRLAVRTEPNKRVRQARRSVLLTRFQRFAGDLTRLPLSRAS